MVASLLDDSPVATLKHSIFKVEELRRPFFDTQSPKSGSVCKGGQKGDLFSKRLTVNLLQKRVFKLKTSPFKVLRPEREGRSYPQTKAQGPTTCILYRLLKTASAAHHRLNVKELGAESNEISILVTRHAKLILSSELR